MKHTTSCHSTESPSLVEVRASDFAFTIAVCVKEAPVSSNYFLADVDGGVLDGSSIFRIVNLQNQQPDHPAKIEVIQMGLREMDPDIAPTIQHESTRRSGLRHRKGTVSLARFAPGAVYHSVFVCMRDAPNLDEGGARNPDGLGFAAFGFVAEGFDHLQRVFEENAYSEEYLGSPICLQTMRRVGGKHDTEARAPSGKSEWPTFRAARPATLNTKPGIAGSTTSNSSPVGRIAEG